MGILFLLSLLLGSDGWGWNALLIEEIRLPRALMALAAGTSLALSGWWMQLLFRNPLASPSILGITNGASLAVSVVTLLGVGAGWMGSGLVVAAGAVGAGLTLVVVLMLGRGMKNITSLLLIGVMIGHLAGALESVFQRWSERMDLAGLVYWNMGTFGKASAWQAGVVLALSCLGMTWTFWRRAHWNAWVLGKSVMLSLGFPTQRIQRESIWATGILTAAVTAFCGPVAFIGLASPHLAKKLQPQRNHASLLFTVVMVGAVLGLGCDLLARWAHLPLNAVTSLLGAPWVIFILLKKVHV